MVGLRPGFIKRADIAWFSSQRHDAAGAAEPYAYSYLFAYALDIPAGVRTITLPDNDRVRILAITVTAEPWTLTPVQPLYDTLERR
jgi:alpha-mannosidase